MDIASLDRLDEYNRMNYLTKYLDNNINQDENEIDDNEEEEHSYPSYLFNDNDQNAISVNETNLNKQEVHTNYDNKSFNITNENFEIIHDEQYLGYHTNIERFCHMFCKLL